MPANIGELSDRINEKTILKMLNSGNCFDIELLHNENDILELHFTFNADPDKYLMLPCHGNYLAYAFKFKKGIWKKIDFDPFNEDLEDIAKGKIIRLFYQLHQKLNP